MSALWTAQEIAEATGGTVHGDFEAGGVDRRRDPAVVPGEEGPRALDDGVIRQAAAVGDAEAGRAARKACPHQERQKE